MTPAVKKQRRDQARRYDKRKLEEQQQKEIRINELRVLVDSMMKFYEKKK
jgi:hypothetical protein